MSCSSNTFTVSLGPVPATPILCNWVLSATPVTVSLGYVLATRITLSLGPVPVTPVTVPLCTLSATPATVSLGSVLATRITLSLGSVPVTPFTVPFCTLPATPVSLSLDFVLGCHCASWFYSSNTCYCAIGFCFSITRCNLIVVLFISEIDRPCMIQTVCKVHVLKRFQCGKYLVAYVLNYR